MMTFAEFQERLNQAGRLLIPEMARAMQRGARLVQRWSQQYYLKGPRPEKLGVVGGRLWRSITTAVEVEGTRVTALVGTNVVYGRIHEKGGTIRPRRGQYLHFKGLRGWVMVRQVHMPPRPFLSTAIRDKQKEVIQMQADAAVAHLKKTLLKVI